MILLLLFLLPAFFYCLTILALLQGLGRIIRHNSTRTPFVSVIVAARNEENRIARLLDSLSRQAYSNYEILVVDDASSDRTSAMIRKFGETDQRVKLIEIRKESSIHISRKKNALSAGIKASRGEILLFTDADCAPPQQWIAGMIREFSESTGVVAGFSPYVLDDGNNPSVHRLFLTILHAFIRYEEIKGALWSAGAIGLKRPWLCTGRSLAYRRSVWNEVGGFAKIAHSVSGDDDLFLQLVARETQWEVRYCLEPETFVPTVLPSTFSEFLRQRKRHFSAGKFFPTKMKIFFFIFHSSNLLLVLGFALTLLSPQLFWMGFWTFLAKVLIDFLFAMEGSRIFNQGGVMVQFLLMEFLYVGYITLIGPLGFISAIDWKPDPPR